jgi:hypothetical protein
VAVILGRPDGGFDTQDAKKDWYPTTFLSTYVQIDNAGPVEVEEPTLYAPAAHPHRSNHEYIGQAAGNLLNPGSASTSTEPCKIFAQMLYTAIIKQCKSTIMEMCAERQISPYPETGVRSWQFHFMWWLGGLKLRFILDK